MKPDRIIRGLEKEIVRLHNIIRDLEAEIEEKDELIRRFEEASRRNAQQIQDDLSDEPGAIKARMDYMLYKADMGGMGMLITRPDGEIAIVPIRTQCMPDLSAGQNIIDLVDDINKTAVRSSISTAIEDGAASELECKIAGHKSKLEIRRITYDAAGVIIDSEGCVENSSVVNQ